MARLIVALGVVLGVTVVLATAAVSAPPVVTFTDQPPATVEATGPDGASLSYTVDAVNNAGKHVDVNCDVPAGTTGPTPLPVDFVAPIGTTTVTCATLDASASNFFIVTVTAPPGLDTTPPTLAPHDDVTIAPGTSPAYVPPTATDDTDPNPTVTCTPGPLDTFAAGTTTTVTCTARDASGNTSQETFTVTVTSAPPPPPPPANSPPTFTSTPSDLTREATGPSGAIVTYTVPAATDPEDGPIVPVCSPAPGATFALGSTTVTCTATDSQGATAQVSFHVTVVDTTPPSVTPPADITFAAASSAGTPSSNATIAGFLGAAVATDVVDTSVTITTNAPATFPVGRTTVTFTARDDSGNTATATANVTVLSPGSPPPPPPPPRDRTPPADVGKLTATAGDRLVRLGWTPPAKDFDHAVVLRALSDTASATTQVYSGKASSLVDRGLENGVEYRYTVIAYDAAGNRSAGAVAVATPHAAMLLAPKDGAKLSRKRPPMLRWRVYPGARYYNVQLFRVPRSAIASAATAADVKVLSAWPNKTRLKLGKKWKYKGRRYGLAKGTYRWYVWPGLGARSAATYGPLLGQQTFVVR
jgi:hypothetical protein